MDNIHHGSADWERQMAISKLFDERPIWPRYSVHERLLDDGLKFSIDQLKRLLFRTGYYFSTGPFSRFWIRKGYDPRKDPESRIYQRIDFRTPLQLRSFGDVNRIDKSKYTWKDLCEFRAFPSKSFTSLQLCELDDDYIQEAIKKPLEHMSFTSSTGWFSRQLFQTLKLRVRMRFLSISPRSDAQDLLESVSKHFEQYKKLQELKRDFVPNEQEHRHMSRDFDRQDHGERQLKPNDVEIVGACEVVEGEDDEDEEELLDDYADGDDTFPLQTSFYPTGANISQDYLQQVFDSFPFPKESDSCTDNVAQEADASDGEYQIYEQDSDDDNDYYDYANDDDDAF